MSIEFRCPNCEKKLRTGDDKAGKSAKCPQCGSAVSVPGKSPVEEDFDQFPAFDDVEDTTSLPPMTGERRRRSSKATEVACPMCGAMNDARATRCLACGEALTARGTDQIGRPAGSLAFGDIFGDAFELWKRELGMMVVATLVSLAIYIVAYVVLLGLPSVLIDSVDNAGDAGSIFILILLPVCLAAFASVAFFLAMGLGGISLDVARGRRAKIERLFSNAKRLPSMWLNMLLVGLAVFVSAIPGIVVSVAGFALAIQQENMGMLFIAGLGYVLYAIALSITPQLVWPVSFMIVDGVRGVRPFVDSVRLFWARPGLVLLLILIGTLFNFVGALACGVGLLFTMPLMLVMYAVAFDRLRTAYIR